MVTLPHPFRLQGHRLLQERRNLVAQSKVELKGKGAKNWKPAPGEGHRKVSSLVWALGWLCWLRGQFPGLTGECLWDPSTILSVIFKVRLFHMIAKFRGVSLLKIGNGV